MLFHHLGPHNDETPFYDFILITFCIQTKNALKKEMVARKSESYRIMKRKKKIVLWKDYNMHLFHQGLDTTTWNKYKSVDLERSSLWSIKL